MKLNIILLLLIMISLSATALEMRDTDAILERMHAKSSKIGVRKDAQLKAVTTLKTKEESYEVTENTKEKVPQENQKKSKDEINWQNNSKEYLTPQEYTKAIREFIELKYPKEFAAYGEKKKKEKAQEAKKAKARKAKEAKARKVKEAKKAKLQKAKEQKIKAQKKELELKQKPNIQKSKDTNVVKTKEDKSTKKISKVMKRDGELVVCSNKLIWQDNKDVTITELNWNKAIEYCENLTLGSYEDWRLPSKMELDSIVDTRKQPAINKKFKNVKKASYWSKSDYKNSKYYAWVLNFKSGLLESNSKTKNSLVRCVRDGK